MKKFFARMKRKIEDKDFVALILTVNTFACLFLSFIYWPLCVPLGVLVIFYLWLFFDSKWFQKFSPFQQGILEIIATGIFLFFALFLNFAVIKYDRAEKEFYTYPPVTLSFDYFDGYYFREIKDVKGDVSVERMTINFPDQCSDGSEQYRFQITVYPDNSRNLIKEVARRNLGWPWTRRFMEWDDVVEMLVDDGFVAGDCYSGYPFGEYYREFTPICIQLENYFEKMGVKVEFSNPPDYNDPTF